MDINQKIDIFLQFLREQRLTDTFVRNMLEHPNLIKRHSNEPIYFLNYAFVWDKTEQGFNYWNAVHNTWIKYYLKKVTEL